MATRCPISTAPGWPEVVLAEITTKIGSGATPRGGAETYLDKRAEFALIRSQNVFDRRFDSNGLAYITNKQAATLRGSQVQKGDILLNITGDGITFGRACMVPDFIRPACVNQHVSIIRVDTTRAAPGFLLAYLTHPDVKLYIESFNAGGSRRAITKGHIESFRLPLPPLRYQHVVAHILGTLDDKIDLNRKTNETLEAMAHALFQSWFVDFDPVHAKAEGRTPSGMDAETASLFPSEFVESEKGRIPQGWRLTTISDVAQISSGKRPVARFDLPTLDAAIPLYGGGGIMAYVPEPLCTGPLLLTGRVGTLGLVFRVTDPCWPSDNTLILRPRLSMDLDLLRYLLGGIDFQSLNRGSTQPLLTQGDLAGQKIVFAPEPVRLAFSKATRDLFDIAGVTVAESQTLTAIRDSLLPRLLSGELQAECWLRHEGGA